jgi:hypothetical protein
MMLDYSLYSISFCHRRAKYTIDGLVPIQKDTKIYFGSVFHKALKHHYLGNTDEAMKALLEYEPEEDSKTHSVGNLILSFNAYIKQDTLKPVEAGGKKLVEVNFALPFEGETLLCGTIDLVAEYMGEKVIVDHKTTSSRYFDTYLQGFRLSPQLMTYVIAYQRTFGERLGAVINGIFLKSNGAADFHKSEIIHFTDEQLNFHLESMRQQAKMLSGDSFPPNYNFCSGKYGLCPYFILCSNPPENREFLEKAYFVRREYNPLTRKD